MRSSATTTASRCASGRTTERADAVVVAVPAPIAARLAVHARAARRDSRAALADLPMGVASKFAVATKERPPAAVAAGLDRSMWCWTANGADGTPRRVHHVVRRLARGAGRRSASTRGELTPWLEAVRAMNPDLTLVDEPVALRVGRRPLHARRLLELGPGLVGAPRCVRATRSGDSRSPASTRPTIDHGTMEGALRSGRAGGASRCSTCSAAEPAAAEHPRPRRRGRPVASPASDIRTSEGGGISVSESTAEPVLLVEDIGPVRRLTMNRPDALNALNGELIEALSRRASTPPRRRRRPRRRSCAAPAGRSAPGYDLNEDAEGGEHDARHWHEELAASTDAHARVHRPPQADDRAGALATAWPAAPT